jgi:hypothetical protein
LVANSAMSYGNPPAKPIFPRASPRQKLKLPKQKEAKAMKTKRDWTALIAAHARSGMTIDAFCRARGIAPSNFYTARHRLGHAKPKDPRQLAVPQLIPMTLTRAEKLNVELRWCDGVVTLSASADDFARLVKAL